MWAIASFAVLLSGAAYASPFERRSIAQRSTVTANWPIKNGYVAFGDSYGAGMGTGTTSTDKCRVGSNNFGALLNKWTNDPKVDYQQLVCSGDTSVGLNRQIDEWKNPKLADVATVSMGGNDLGFSDLVWYCVITPNTARWPSTNRKNCLDAQAKAKAHMTDSTATGLRSILKTAYLRILTKSTRSDFHMYVTGYVEFFNQVDTDCDKTSFHYLWSGYDQAWDPRRVLLTTSLRQELNVIVDQLTDLIQAVVSDANAEHGGPAQVHFVDVNSKFVAGQHRWCEQGDFHEPDESRADTWFFLSAWKDVDIETTDLVTTDDVQESTIEQGEIQALVKGGSVPMPDASNCSSSLGTDPDPWALWQCRFSEEVALDGANGTFAIDLAAANADIANGVVNSTHIPNYIATRQIKTFHPRSPGMVAYRDAIIAVINSVQVNAANTTSTLPPTPTPCSGNQVEGACTAGALPSSTPYSGVQPPSCEKADGEAGSRPRVNTTQASDAASTFCNQLISDGVVLTATASDVAPYTVPGVAENGTAMSLVVMYDVNACPTDKSKTTVNFKALGLNECFQNMYVALSEVCVEDSTWTDYNPNFTMEGGVFVNDCAIWSISSD